MTGLCLSFLALSQPASAEQSRRVELEIEPVIVLRCAETLSVDLRAAQVLAALENAPARHVRATARPESGGVVSATFRGLAPAATAPTVRVPVAQGCAIRGLSRGEGFGVDIRLGRNPVLTGEDRLSRIRVQQVSGRIAAMGAPARRFTIPQSLVRLDRWIDVGFVLDLDLSDAAVSGTYRSERSEIFTVDVSAP